MRIINKFFHSKILYIFFVFLSLIIFFFSTVKSEAKAFEINNIDVSRPFEINFDKNEVIDEGFRKAFFELISLITKSQDKKKIHSIKLNKIKAMVETFSIKEEKFIDETYFVNLGVSFNRKKIFNYLREKNIFPSIPLKKRIFFIPIIIDENKNDLLIFSNNNVFKKWEDYTESFHLIDYVLPTEDLEDLNLIKSKYEIIEKYDFKEITSKYFLKDSIIALIFKNENDLRILSKINIQDKIILKNQTFSQVDISNDEQIDKIIPELKLIYEDFWKNLNQINTSIKLPLNIKIDNNNNLKILNFEKTLEETDLIYDFFIQKFNKDFTFYQITFNGTPDVFLETMKKKDYNFDIQNKIWHLK
tara:strand:- start:357 stop:1436 length:1080 start_codon:yes stop_codon:yes gene_type:complete